MTVVLGPMVSQAADCWGRRWFLIGLTAFGGIGSITVSRATSMNEVIAGFTITGLSYGAQPLLHTVSSEVLPRRYRSWAQAADLVSMALGGITALLVGGALGRSSTDPTPFAFRSFWYMTTAIFVLAAILTLFLYNPPPTKKQLDLTLSQKLLQLDWIGYFLLTSGLVLFSIGLSWSQDPYPWSNPHTSATFAVGVILIGALCMYETLFKKDGMFHHGLFQNRNFAITLVCICCEGVAFFAANQYFAFETGLLYETDNLLVGLRYSMTMFVSIFSALLTGLYCATTRRVRWVTVVGFLFFVSFFIGMGTSGPVDSTKTWGYTVLLGMALGMTLCGLVTTAQLSTPADLIAITSGLVISLRSFGGAIGLAICKFRNLVAHPGSVLVPAYADHSRDP